MGRHRETEDPGRFLFLRDGKYHYKRRVPQSAIAFDERAPQIRVSLKTADLAQARAKRDLLEAADNELWAMLTIGADPSAAQARYRHEVKRVEALGFVFRSSAEIANQTLDEILRRVETAAKPEVPLPIAAAVIGDVDRPDEKLSAVIDLYLNEIARDDVKGKSPEQKHRWRSKKQASVATFIREVSDRRMTEISREDATKFFGFWLNRIAPKTGRPTHSADSGNRDLGNMRTIYEAYFDWIGQPDRPNPFAKLFFAEKNKASRPPFPTTWIRDKILKPGALSSLNDEARGIVLTMVETGARLGEVCNLRAEEIKLSAEVPHIVIQPSDDPDAPREIKTASSVRVVPLVGVALAAMQAHPQGFPRYRDRASSLSGALGKHFRVNDLLPTPKHTVYSLRHSFEDRMKEAGLDDELRRSLMGHTIDRPRYGSGGSLTWRRDELLKLALPFDPAIV